MTGIRLTDKAPAATVEKLVGIRTTPTTRVAPITVDDLAEQLLAGKVGTEIDKAGTAASAGIRSAKTWAELAAVAGSAALQKGEVTDDAGTHTDPVVGGTVPNKGIFSWSVSPAGWKRTGEYIDVRANTVSGAGIATGNTPVGDNPVITVPKATSTTVRDNQNDTEAVTPSMMDVGVEADFGDRVLDEDFAAVLLRDGTGVPIIASNYDGTAYIRSTFEFTDAEYETVEVDEVMVIQRAKRWGSEKWEHGPFKDLPARFDGASATIDAGNVVALLDREIKATFNDVSPRDPKIVDSDLVYKTVSGGLVSIVKEDLLAKNSLAAGTTKMNAIYGVGQSTGIGRECFPLLSTTALNPGRSLMHKGCGMRVTGTVQTSSYVNTPVAKSDLVEWVDAFERLDSISGETPFSAMGNRLVTSGAFASTEAFLFTTVGVGGTGYMQNKKGTVPYANLLAAIKRDWIMCQALGIPMEVSIDVFFGQNDRGAAAGVVKGYLVQWQSDLTADVQAIIPGHGQVVFYVSSLANWTAPTYADTFSFVPGDIAQAARENPTKIVYAGSEYILPTASDGVHFTNVGSYMAGDMHAGARIRHKAGQASCFKAASATRSGATLTLTCNVPVGPIVRDAVNVTPPDADAGIIAGVKDGFRYYNPAAPTTISSIAILGSDLIFTLASNPGSLTANERLFMGCDGAAGANGGPTTGPRICYRDSDAGTHPYGNRRNWLAADIITPT